MTNAPLGQRSCPPVISRRGEIVLGAGAIAALMAGAFWLFSGGPAPIEAAQQMALLTPAPASGGDSSPMPKLDHDDPANPTIAFMTAVSLAHVASLKLPPVASVPGAKAHVALVKVRATRARPNVISTIFRPLPPRRPADLDSARLIQSKTTSDDSHVALATPVQLVASAPPAKRALPLIEHLTAMVPTPEKLGRGIVWVGDSVGSLARKL